MEDPNLMQNTTSISPDKKDNMTSVSPPKRTIVLGVVNTTGMKSTNINRKRRWDQPPEDISGPPINKKLCIIENEEISVKETESLETASAVSPNVDRVNSQCDNISGLSNQSTHTTLVENEEISIELSRSHSSDISSEASAMSIDLPEDKSEKCKPLCEPSSDFKVCSDPNENLSEVNILKSCDRLKCVETTVNSPTADSRFIASDVMLDKETSCVSVCETKIVKHELKSNVSATVISHQSDELRRIMFSYDEGSSDSDTLESTKEENADDSISTNKLNRHDEDVISVPTSIQSTGFETSDLAAERVGVKETIMSENDVSFVSSVSIVEKTSSIQPEFNSNETDAFIESSKSLESLGENEGSLIESQLNIPIKSEVAESTNKKEIKCDSLVNKTLKKTEELVDRIHNQSSIDIADSTISLLPEVIDTPNLRHLGPDKQNSAENVVINKIDLINMPSNEDIKNNQFVNPVREDISTNNDLISKMKLHERSEVDNASKELSSNYDYSEERVTNSHIETQQEYLMNKISLKINNEEAFDKIPKQSTALCESRHLNQADSSKHELKLESEVTQILRQDSNISDDEMKINSSTDVNVSSAGGGDDAEVFLDTSSPEVNTSQGSLETNVKTKERSSYISDAHVESVASDTLPSEITEKNHELVLSPKQKTISVIKVDSELVNLIAVDETSKKEDSEVVIDNIEKVVRPQDSQSDITAIDTSNENSNLSRILCSSDKVPLKDSNILISEMPQGTDQSSEHFSVSIINKQVEESLIEEGYNIAMDVTPSENIDPAVMEVILGSNEGTAIVKEGANDRPIVGGTESELKLKHSVIEFDHSESVVISVDSQEKMDIVYETSCSQSEPEKSLHGNQSESIANTNDEVDNFLTSDLIIDKNSKLTKDGKDSISVTKVKEIINPDYTTPVENAVDFSNAVNAIENNIGIDHSPGIDTEVVESYSTKFTEENIILRKKVSEESIPVKASISNIETKTLENTESQIDTMEVKEVKLNLNIIENNELDSKTDQNDENLHRRDPMLIEANNAETSSLGAEQTELRSIENNDIEISTEETIETEISNEENVESELCSLESDEVVTVETNINSLNDVENVITIENSDSKNNVVSETHVITTVENDENVHNKSDEDVAEPENNTENIFQSCIKIGSNMSDISTSRETTNQEVTTNINAVSLCLESKEVSDATQEMSKELIVQEEITLDEDSVVEECVYDNASLAIREDDIVLTSVDSPTYEGELNPSPEESKLFEKSIDVSETIDDEIDIDSNVIIEPVVEETKTFTHKIDSSEVVAPIEISSEISYVEENMLEDDSKTLTEDIEESFVVEEVVTCESPNSNKDADNEIGSLNEDVSSLIVFEETCETTESFVNNEVKAVIKENTIDSEVSVIDNQNEFSNDSNVGLKKLGESNIVKSVQKHISISKDLINEPIINSIRPDSPSLDMECESSVNSITKTDSDVEMDIDEPPSLEISKIGLKVDSIKVGKPSPSVLNIGSDLTTVSKDGGINVPLLTTVNNSAVLIPEKPTSTTNVEINRSGSIPGIDPKLEPITLRIYKDNLSVRTDDLESPKKNRSPKLSSELKSQLSPHIKSSDSRSSLSPTTKKLEFTLKIAKDINTNIPRATMSPKNSVSPSGLHKPGDILRAELTAESGRHSPAYMSPESGANKVKHKIPKPGLANEYISHIQSSMKEEINMKDDTVVDQSSGISLPKPPIEIGNVLKKMMETEKSVDSKPEITVMDHSLNSSLLTTPISTPVVRKRGRPRKILQKVLPGIDPSLNSNLISGHNPAMPFNHTPGTSPGLDISSGLDSSDQSSRQVRSCRARTKPIVVKTRKPRGGGARGGMRGRGAISSGVGGIVRNLAAEIDQDKLAGKLSEREKAELAKIEERKERQRQERHAKNEAKKAKKLARKLKDEERRLKKLREKAEKAEAAAPQVFEEETRMSAPDGGSRGHTPAPASALSRLNQTSEHNEESQNSISTPTSSQIKRGRMEIPIDPECKEVRVEHLAEYQWQGSELFMVQEQVSLYLGVKSFKRKYPDLKRRPVEAEERTFLEDSGLVPKSMCDLGLTAVSSAEILDIMYQDFPDKYEEFRKYVREKQAKEASFKQKAVFASLKQDKSKGEPREQALEAVAMWNSNLNRERREERRCALDLQTFTVHYPKQMRDRMVRPVPKAGLYPVSLIPGQFSDSFKMYTPTELMYFPLNTVMYGPLKPNERQPINPSDGSGSDSSSSSSSDDSSSSSSECESEDENSATRECKICNGEKKTNKESHPEILLQCSNCKGLCHPTCQEITPEMLPHIKKYNWHCSNCKKCMICRNTTKDDKMLFCDLCDRGYHIHCVGLRKAPDGRWHCSVCSFCTVCGSKDPGGPEWNYEYKKTDKGVRLYQRTLCVPCSKNALM